MIWGQVFWKFAVGDNDFRFRHEWFYLVHIGGFEKHMDKRELKISSFAFQNVLHWADIVA